MANSGLSAVTLTLFLPLIALCALGKPFEGVEGTTDIKNIVVVMFENRAFDHMLGYLHTLNPEIDGLDGTEYNLKNPNNPASEKVYVSFDADPLIGIDPGHSVPDMEVQMWGSYDQVIPAPMDGYLNQSGGDPRVMRCYNSSTLSILSTLAMEFAVFDRFYSSLPGPTIPNRNFLHSGTSAGLAVDPSWETDVLGYHQRTIYNDLEDAGLDWAVYFSDFPIVTFLSKTRDYPLRFKQFQEFIHDAKEGKLPQFSFLEPRWFTVAEWERSDQHPPHSTLPGELFLKDIYEALRSSPQWNQTLFIITYDENGGLYDHAPPPQSHVPNPDGLNSTDPSALFNFTRLGVRIPVVMVSPWIEKGSVYHEPAMNHYDHTSVFHTARELLNISLPPLTEREAWSATFTHAINPLNRTTPRTDCPVSLPTPIGADWNKYVATRNSPISLDTLHSLTPPVRNDTLDELQRSILVIAYWIAPGGVNVEKVKQINDSFSALLFVLEQLVQFFRHV